MTRLKTHHVLSAFALVAFAVSIAAGIVPTKSTAQTIGTVAGAGSQTFTSSGTFTVPNYTGTLTVTVNGAGGAGGGGGVGIDNGGAQGLPPDNGQGVSGNSGTGSSFGSVYANGGTAGGPGGSGNTESYGQTGVNGDPGTASGGDSNVTGGGSDGGVGGWGYGYHGNIGFWGKGGDGGEGGAGGKAVKTYTTSTLAPGSTVSVAVGTGGRGWQGPCLFTCAGSGSNGSVTVSWTDAATPLPPPPPPPPVCGNGTVESGEACDAGSANGTCSALCSNTCTIKTNTCVEPPTLSCDITFDKNPINNGENTTIHWTSTSAASFDINTIGPIPNVVISSGSATVQPSATTDYRGTVTGLGDVSAAKKIFLTSGSSWTVPDDWNSSNNSIEAIGGGGGGASILTGSPGDGGGAGGGGAYSKINNLALTPRASITIAVGALGIGAITTGVAGGDTYFNGASCSQASVCAKGGNGASDGTGGSGGPAALGIGTTKFSGGVGGNGGIASGTNGGGAGGAGGAAGPNGAGNAGANATAQDGGSGGSGDANFGGAGGAGGVGADGSNGFNGSEFSSSKGSGGGGGGAAGGGNGQNGFGHTFGTVSGMYGAGGVGAAGRGLGFDNGNIGASSAGIIVITYSPVGGDTSGNPTATCAATLTVTAPTAPTAHITADNLTMEVGDTNAIHATFTSGASDTITGDNIDGDATNPGGVVGGLGATTDPDDPNNDQKNIVFVPDEPGLYTFHARLVTTNSPAWATYDSVTVTVTDNSCPSGQIKINGTCSDMCTSPDQQYDPTSNQCVCTVSGLAPDATTGLCPVQCTAGEQVCGGAEDDVTGDGIGDKVYVYSDAACHKNYSFTCDAATYCSDGQCHALPPAVNIRAAPSTVVTDHSTNIAWMATSVSACTISGTNGQSWSGASSGDPVATCSATNTTCPAGSLCLGTQCVNSRITVPIQSKTTYTLSCTGLDGTSMTKSANVNTIGTFQEK